MVWPMDDSQGPSPSRGHSPWLVCEVALNSAAFQGWHFSVFRHLYTIDSLLLGKLFVVNKDFFD